MEKPSKKEIDFLLEHIENYNDEIEKQIHMAEEMFNEYFKEGIKEEDKFRNKIEEIKKIKNAEECEVFINTLSNEIPNHILMSQFGPTIKMLFDFTKDSAEKVEEFDSLAEYALKNILSKKQKERLAQAKIRKEQLLEERNGLMQTLASDIFPMLSLSKEKWGFLWNLGNWKFNALLTKQMRRYTFWVMILTLIVVFFMLISIWFQLTQ